VALGALALSGCSLIIDLPADCSAADCNGYQCNPANTECLFVCIGPDDCSDGYVCDNLTGAGTCVARGCAPLSPQVLFFDGTRDLDEADVDSNGESIAAAYVATGALRFKTYSALDGSSSPAITVEPAEYAPQSPTIASDGANYAIVWESDVRFEGAQRELLRFAVMDPAGQVVVAPMTLWVAGFPAPATEKSVDQPEMVWDDARQAYVIVFASRIDASSDLVMLAVRADGMAVEGGEVEHADAKRITLDPTDALDPIVVLRDANTEPASNFYDVLYREGTTTLDLSLRTLTSEAQRAEDDLKLSSVASGSRVEDFAAVGLGGRLVVTWSEGDASDGDSYQRTLDPIRTPDDARPVVRDLQDTRGAGLMRTPDEAEYATAHAGVYRGVRDIYVTRYAADGARLTPPFPITSGDDSEPAHPALVPTVDGFLALWEATEGEDAGTIQGRYWDCSFR